MSRRHCISKLQKYPLKVVNINGKDDAIFVNLTSSIVQASSSDVHFKCLPLPNSWCNRYNIDRAQQSADQELSEVFNLLDYCFTNNITQPSRVKSEQKLFVIGEDDPQGVQIAFFFSYHKNNIFFWHSCLSIILFDCLIEIKVERISCSLVVWRVERCWCSNSICTASRSLMVYFIPQLRAPS